MIDPKIRNRLMELPGEFRKATLKFLEASRELALEKEGRANQEAVLIAGLAALWQDAKSNESIRKAQAEAALRGDPTYTDLDKAVRDRESWVNRWKMTLDTLRFEAEVLIAVANNDHSLLSVE